MNIRLYSIFFTLIGFQIIFFYKDRYILPRFQITELPPSKLEIGLKSAGDKEYIYRKLLWDLKSSGDKLGVNSWIESYDYNKLYIWFKELEKIDTNSHAVSEIAAKYYGSTRNTDNLHIIAKYLLDNFDSRVDEGRTDSLIAVLSIAYEMKDDNLISLVLERSIKLPVLESPLILKFFGLGYFFEKKDYCKAVFYANDFDEKFLLVNMDDRYSKFIMSLSKIKNESTKKCKKTM